LEPILSRVASPGLDPPISKKQTPYLQKLPRHRADPVPRGLERLEPRETPDGPSGVRGEGEHQRAHALWGEGEEGEEESAQMHGQKYGWTARLSVIPQWMHGSMSD
jgi:hypothetical protein